MTKRALFLPDFHGFSPTLALIKKATHNAAVAGFFRGEKVLYTESK